MITRQQRKAMLFIQNYVDRFGCPPSYAEISEHMGTLQRSSAHRLVHSLKERGYLANGERLHRSMVIVQRVVPRYATFVFDDVAKEFRRME